MGSASHSWIGSAGAQLAVVFVAMAPKIKVVYFDLMGRAELTRLILAQAGVEYEDVRIKREDWPAMKPTIPWNQLPMLEYDGKKIVQSIAMARFFAREYGLAGKNNLEAAQADMLVDCMTDLQNKYVPVLFQPDEAKKKEMAETFIKEQLTPFMKNLAGALKDNGGQWLVGSDLTYADIMLASLLGTLEKRHPGVLSKEAPLLYKHMSEVYGLPKIKEWIAKRPKTEF